MLAFFDFLMFELETVFDELDDPGEQAEAIIVTMAAVDKSIPESFYRLYVDHLNIDKDILSGVLAFYSGIDEIHIECDCLEDKYICDIFNLDRNGWFKYGQQSKNNTAEWYDSHSRVRDLHYELWSEIV